MVRFDRSVKGKLKTIDEDSYQKKKSHISARYWLVEVTIFKPLSVT